MTNPVPLLRKPWHVRGWWKAAKGFLDGAGLWKSLAIGFKASLALTFILLLIPNWYSSNATILPSPSNASMASSPLSAMAGAIGITIPGANTENWDDICSSRWVAERVIRKKYTFHKPVTFFGPTRKHVETLYDYIGQKNMDLSVMEFEKKILNVSQDPKSMVITLTVETHSPELSFQICSDILNLLQEYLHTKSMTHGKEKATFSEQRLDDAKIAYRSAEAALINFSNDNRSYQQSLDPRVRLEGHRLEVELQLKEQLVSSLTLNNEQFLLQSKDDTPILQILDEANLPVEKSKPKRGAILIAFLVLTAGAHWLWTHRAELRRKMIDLEPSAHPSIP